MTASPRVRSACRRCGLTAWRPLPLDAASPGACRRCGASLPARLTQVARPGVAMRACCVCGDDKLYLQKDFDQRVGCLIVAAGAALVPWTYGLSLAICALLDWLLYRALPTITLCYVCGARFRGMPLNPDHSAYDLMTAQTWEARALAWRRGLDAGRD